MLNAWVCDCCVTSSSNFYSRWIMTWTSWPYNCFVQRQPFDTLSRLRANTAIFAAYILQRIVTARGIHNLQGCSTIWVTKSLIVCCWTSDEYYFKLYQQQEQVWLRVSANKEATTPRVLSWNHHESFTNYNLVITYTEYLRHKWIRKFFVCRNHIPVLFSFMTWADFWHV